MRSIDSNVQGLSPLPEHVNVLDSQVHRECDNGVSEAGDSTVGTSGSVPDPNEANGSQLNQLPSQVDHRPSLETDDNDAKSDELLLDKILDETAHRSLPFTHPSVWMRTADGDEYTGPSSGIATISDLGLKWIRQHVSDSQVLCDSILDIRNSVLGHLRQPKCVPPGPYSTPGTPTILKPIVRSEVAQYVDAYFSTVQTIFPILDREQFEYQAAKHGIDAPGTMYSWNALLNAVLASGCRGALSDETAEAFQVSGSEAWGYFQNAMYYASKLVNISADLLGVQALAVMTVFAQGMSSPQRLEFTMVSAATRLAQSLALHHCPPREWELSEKEQQERNRLFWVIYCLDKTIALRCGRPPVLRDNEISCAFPHGEGAVLGAEHGSELAGHAHKVDLLLSAVKIARICGMITEKLYSASGLHLPASKLQQTATTILRNLESWRRSLPASVQPGKPYGKIRGLSHSSRMQLLVMHSTYYYVLCAIYRRFTPMFTRDGKDSRHLVSQSTEITHVEAARSIILLTKFFDIESFTPGWLVFYYPFTALTTLFLHVVGNPSEESARDDIALMEIVVGFFGRLEYVTSGEAAFTKTTEFVRQARSVVTNASMNREFQQRSDLDLEHNRIMDLPAECVVQRVDEPMMDASVMLPRTGHGSLPRIDIEDPAPTLITPYPGSGEAHGIGPMDTGDELREPHQHDPTASFFTNLPGAASLHSEEMLNERWLEDWITPVEKAPTVL
ncbi:hypothetical protein MRS44_009652 [Fusarium solani]|uniref:uncharacterized protein n=1 Tax=Fusarium solani TaxID=169388 RepID=UPI0032C3EAA4|nr:hypothetical protein MRS44_009652 [Fusarium solani]